MFAFFSIDSNSASCSFDSSSKVFFLVQLKVQLQIAMQILIKEK